MQFYDITEVGSQSTEKLNYFPLALDKVHKELILMEDGAEKKHKKVRKDMSTNDSNMFRSKVITKFLQTYKILHRCQQKCLPKNLRLKKSKVTQAKKKNKHCRICKNERHAKNYCPLVSYNKLQFFVLFFNLKDDIVLPFSVICREVRNTIVNLSKSLDL